MSAVNKPLLYSRQTRILGSNSIESLFKASVLVININGVGAETAKNLILAGVGTVHLYDESIFSFHDLSSHGFCNAENSVGKNRAEESREKLQELNQYSQVKVVQGPLSIDLLSSYKAVVYSSSFIGSEAIRINTLCHEAGVNFVLCCVSGLVGVVFEDFGEFTTELNTGRNREDIPIKELRPDDEGTWVVSLSSLSRNSHGIELGSLLQINGIPEIPEIVTVSKCNFMGEEGAFLIPQKFDSLPSFSSSRPFARVVFPTLSVTCVPLAEHLAKINTYFQPHLVMQVALGKYYEKHQRLPSPRNNADAIEYTNIFNSYHAELGSPFAEFLTNEYLHSFAKTSCGNIIQMAAALGGLAAQEVIKSIINKFAPLSDQCMELSYLSTHYYNPDASEDNYQPENCRYDGQISIFGRELQRVMADHSTMIIGIGAVGCEIMKNCAIVGVAVGHGMIHAVDNDTIAISNLHRQLLFREQDVAKFKSEVAAAAVQKSNSACHVTAHTSFFDEQSSCTEYNSSLWEKLQSVFSVVDSAAGRKLIYRFASLYNIPMLNAGTYALEGSANLRVPGVTEQYSASITTQAECPGEIGIPYLNQHAVKWGLGQFNNMFYTTPQNFQDHHDSPNENEMADLRLWLDNKFSKFFVEDIKTILATYGPEDPIWKGHKMRPNLLDLKQYESDISTFFASGLNILTRIYSDFLRTRNLADISPVTFEKDDEHHINFLYSAARLYGACYHLQLNDKEYVRAVAGNIQPAIITTTSIVSGLAMMGLFNICSGLLSIDSISYVNVNTAKSGLLTYNPCEGPHLFLSFADISTWDVGTIIKKIEAIAGRTCCQLKFVGHDLPILHDFYPKPGSAERIQRLQTSMGKMCEQNNVKAYAGSPYILLCF